MKKSLYFVALAALMASCANEESVQVGTPSNAIGFNTYVGKTTKAGDVTTANLESFWVYGGFADADLVFDAVEVTSSGEGWTYLDTKYWVEGKNYTFAAVAPQVDATYDLETLTINGYEAGEDDLIVATTGSYTAKESENPAVSLNFKHALAKVQFSFKNGYANVENVKVKGVNSKGDLTAKYGTEGVEFEWENVGTPTTYTYSEALYLIPQDVTETMILSFTQDNKNWDVTLKLQAVPNWEAGKVYNYTLNLSEGQQGIEFEVTEPGWDNPSDNPLGDPQESEGPKMKEESLEFSCIADTWLRESSPDESSRGTAKLLELQDDKNDNNPEVPYRRVILIGFDWNLPENAEIVNAKMHLVTERYKGDANVYMWAYDSFEENTSWNKEKSKIENLINNKSNNFEPKGHWNKAIFNEGISTENQSLSAWTNDIDITDLVQSISGNKANFMLHSTGGQNCFYSKDNEGQKGENNKAFPKTDAETELEKEDLLPYLKVTFLVPDED